MKINKIVEAALSADAVELLNLLGANVLAALPQQGDALYSLVIEQESWSATMMQMREIFDAEVVVPNGEDWIAFRILQSFGIKQGQLVYQFTPTFTETLST